MSSVHRPFLAALAMVAASAGFSFAGAQEPNEQDPSLDEIVVTGSRIPQRGLDSVSPIVEVPVENFDARGAMRYEDVLNRLPQVVAAPENSTTTGRAAGTAQVDLRGLGPERTLVLLNGRRMPYGSPTDLPTDINQIPFALLEDVEVLTGGSSAVYGSDALAGVVNFTLRDDFEGLKIETVVGGYQHRNDNETVQAVVAPWEAANPGEYVLPDENVWDGLSTMFSVAAGINFADGRANATVFATYRTTDEVKMSERDYTTCQLGNAPPDGVTYTCRPSPVDAPASFVNTGAEGLPSEFRVLDGEFALRDPMTDRFNDQQYEQFLRDQEQLSFGGLAHFEINEHLIPFIESSFYTVDTAGDFSPTGVLNSGIIPNVGAFNCDNPFFSDQQADFLCVSRGLSTASNYDPVTGEYLGPGDVATGVVINRRTIENGNRNRVIDLSTYRVVAGLRGNVTDSFQYEISGTYADVSLNQFFDGVNHVRTADALFAVMDQRLAEDGTPLDPGTFGQPACAINVDDSPVNDNPDCAPLDYWSNAGPSQAAVDFIHSRGFSFGNTSLTDMLGTISGDLGDYGLVSPFAVNGIGVAIGAEARKNTLDMEFDLETQEQLLGTPVAGSTSVSEYFGEVNIPLVEDRQLLEELSFEGAYRYSDYDSFSTDTYKLGLAWSPTSDIKFRASFQRAVRAPNVIELFEGQTRSVRLQLAQNPDGSFDPCSGPEPFATFEQCARTGVTAADYGNIADNSFVGELIGGNPDLGPETGDTYVAGFVLRPTFAPNLTATLDYFSIEVEDLIGIINPNITLSQCLEDGNPLFCDLIHRGAGGTLFATADSYIATLNVNTGSLETSGWDLTVDYSLDLAALSGRNLGEVNLSLMGTFLDEYIIQPLPTSTAEETFDCAGYHGFACRHPKPEWRHFATVGWDTPWADVWLGATWRYIAAVDISTKSSQPALAGTAFPVQDLSSASYLDLSLAWRPREDLAIRAGINNVLDEDPPLTTEFVGDVGGNGNSYLGFYDPLGRFFFVSASMSMGF
jgi:outer membrane receptor protein involved in Fe transport